VRLNWSFLRLAMLASGALALAGCGGVNASQSVSPASFFLPGIIKSDTPTNVPALTPDISTKIATVR
jgi:hypothetical protein